MNRKREPKYFKPKINNDIIFQKEKSFSINSSNIKNIRQINKSRNVINEMQPDPINCEIKNNFKKLLSESSNNLKKGEYNNPKIFINDKEGDLFSYSSIIKNTLNKLKYFNIEKNILLISNYSPLNINVQNFGKDNFSLYFGVDSIFGKKNSIINQLINI